MWCAKRHDALLSTTLTSFVLRNHHKSAHPSPGPELRAPVDCVRILLSPCGRNQDKRPSAHELHHLCRDRGSRPTWPSAKSPSHRAPTPSPYAPSTASRVLHRLRCDLDPHRPGQQAVERGPFPRTPGAAAARQCVSARSQPAASVSQPPQSGPTWPAGWGPRPAARSAASRCSTTTCRARPTPSLSSGTRPDTAEPPHVYFDGLPKQWQC